MWYCSYSGGYTYQLTPQDLAREQKAFEPGPGVSTHTTTTTTTTTTTITTTTTTTTTYYYYILYYYYCYLSQRLATKGINDTIQTAIFSTFIL